MNGGLLLFDGKAGEQCVSRNGWYGRAVNGVPALCYDPVNQSNPPVVRIFGTHLVTAYVQGATTHSNSVTLSAVLGWVLWSVMKAVFV